MASRGRRGPRAPGPDRAADGHEEPPLPSSMAPAPAKSSARRRCSDYSNFAGDEKGLLASTTNITSECRSEEPLLETCIGVSAP